MNRVNRYSVGVDGIDPNGNLVKYSDYEELQRKVEALAVEGAGLKSAGNKMFLTAISLMADPDVSVDHARDIKDWEGMKTPATDAALAEVRAQAIDEFGIYHNFSGKLMIQVEAKKYAEKLRKESGQ